MPDAVLTSHEISLLCPILLAKYLVYCHNLPFPLNVSVLIETAAWLVSMCAYMRQDTVAAKNDSVNFLDFGVDPSKEPFGARRLPHPSNFVFYNKIGNVGYFGFSSA